MSSEHAIDTGSAVPDALGHDATGGHGAHAEGEHKHGLTDMQYVYVALALAVMTGLEVVLSYAGLPGNIFMPALLILMAVKFYTVVSLFMHLRFDNKIFTWLFYSGLFLAIFVFVAALATFHLFETS